MEVKHLTALAEPTRLRIIELLREKPYSVNEIVMKLQLNQPQASKHLKYLATAGFVRVRPVAQQRIYSLNSEPFLELNNWLLSFERHWDSKLSKLDRYLNNVKKG